MKNTEETREAYAKEKGFESWHSYINEDIPTEEDIDQIAIRHSIQYIHKINELSAWKESMMKVHSELDLQKIGNALDMLVGTPIAPNVLPKILDLKQSNKELVEMLERSKWEFEQFKDAFGQVSLLINEIEQLILKHDKK